MIVGAVGTLTDLRPGTARATTPKPTPPRVVQPPPAPPRGAFVDAGAGRPARGRLRVRGRPGDRDADERQTATASIDTPVTIDGQAGEDCGRGCFARAAPGRDVAVDVGGTTLRFHGAGAAPARDRRGEPAAPELRRAPEPRHRRAPLVRARAASQVSVFREQAPGDMAYVITADSNEKLVGTQGIVIGDRRWDKLPGGRWLPGPQSPLTLPKAYWTASARNAYFTRGRTR